jgi:hypothetical protein
MQHIDHAACRVMVTPPLQIDEFGLLTCTLLMQVEDSGQQDGKG